MNLKKIIKVSVLSLFTAVLSYFVVEGVRYTKDLRESHIEALNELKQLNTELDSLKLVNQQLLDLVDSKEYIIDSLEALSEDQEDKIQWLNNELQDVLDEVESINADTIYKELQVMYDTVDVVKPYKFSDPAIRGIYKDVLMLPYMDGVIVAQDSIISIRDEQLSVKEQIIQALGQGNQAKQNLIESLYNDMSNLTVQNAILEADNKLIKITKKRILILATLLPSSVTTFSFK